MGIGKENTWNLPGGESTTRNGLSFWSILLLFISVFSISLLMIPFPSLNPNKVGKKRIIREKRMRLLLGFRERPQIFVLRRCAQRNPR